MTDTVVTDNSGKTLKVKELRGRLYPRFPTESLENVGNFKARPEDILLCTYPKSGTHWTFEIIRLLLAGDVDIPLVEKDDTMIEDAPPSSIENLPSPRNINSHFHFGSLSPEFLKQKCKIIYVVRDPRDVAVSYFHHHKKLGDYYDYTGEWKDYLNLYLEGKVDYDSWFEYTKGWEKGMKEHPDHPFLVLCYETMKAHPVREIRRIADFIGVKYTEEFLVKVGEKTNFSAMQTQRQQAGGMVVMYRKGKAGDWKNHFTVAQSEIFNKKFEEEMMGTDAYDLYSHTVQKQSDANMNSV